MMSPAIQIIWMKRFQIYKVPSVVRKIWGTKHAELKWMTKFIFAIVVKVWIFLVLVVSFHLLFFFVFSAFGLFSFLFKACSKLYLFFPARTLSLNNSTSQHASVVVN